MVSVKCQFSALVEVDHWYSEEEVSAEARIKYLANAITIADFDGPNLSTKSMGVIRQIYLAALLTPSISTVLKRKRSLKGVLA